MWLFIVKAGLMLIAWLILAPLGITISRYYKFIFPNKKIFGLKIWFFLHRPIMILAFTLTLISFLIILADKNWTWINIRSLHSFIHSIFGITVIGLIFFQVYDYKKVYYTIININILNRY